MKFILICPAAIAGLLLLAACGTLNSAGLKNSLIRTALGTRSNSFSYAPSMDLLLDAPIGDAVSAKAALQNYVSQIPNSEIRWSKMRKENDMFYLINEGDPYIIIYVFVGGKKVSSYSLNS